MIVIKNNILPAKGFSAMTFWPFIFTRENMDAETLKHEKKHGKQQLLLLIIPFYLIYLIEYLIKGYDNISFEREAYDQESKVGFLSFLKYMNK